MVRKFSMLLLSVLFSMVFFACSSPESLDDQEPSKEAGQLESTDDGQLQSTDDGFHVGGLDFHATPDDVIEKLGKPTAVQSAPGVTVYYFSNIKKNEYHGNRVCFVGDKLCSFQIIDERLPLPKGIKVGDSIVKALREYSTPNELGDLGIDANDTDEEILRKINARRNVSIYLDNYKNSRVNLHIDLPDGEIERITVARGSEKDDTITIETPDFTAGAEAIAEKFGYPDEILIDNKSAFDFIYTGKNAEINFLKTPSLSANSFHISNNWAPPYGIKIGDKIEDVFEKLYKPEDTGYLNPERSYISFDLLQDYDFIVGIAKGGTVEQVWVNKFDRPQYMADRAADPLEAPTFIVETVATKADLYLSECTIGSSRFEVCEMLGSPQKTEAGFDELTGNAQNYYFENAVVYFRDVTDYGDPKTGSAWRYFTKDSEMIGPRGLRVGDSVERILEVFPGRDDIDFKTITSPAAIYGPPLTPGDDTNSAMVYPSDRKTYTGEVNFTIDWIYGISFHYEDGIITSMELFAMID